MRITITGSLGPISRPLASKLIADGHEVTIITRSSEKNAEIEQIGAKAAIGSINDINFLTECFTGADSVYLMEPTVNMYDPTIDLLKHYEKICEEYAQAVINSGVNRIVHLSSIGGHASTGNGMLAFHYYAEQVLKKLPENIAIITLRPASFYSNILAFIPTIKSQNSIITSYVATEPEPWASPNDIASVAAKELSTPFTGRKVRYIISDEVSSTKLVKVLSEATGLQIQWVTISHDSLRGAYESFGMSSQAAAGFAKLNEAKISGTLYEDLIKHKNEVIFGNEKIEDFARGFARIFQQK
jgi:uncharacterized protein YbjT (DUF2867 family)